MTLKLLLLITIFAVVLTKNSLACAKSQSLQHVALSRMTRMRCTRRFSPGSCTEDVAPVWTFEFMAQNCTERLGCHNSFRTNRFPTYRTCMRRCEPLVDVYFEMVKYEAERKKNETCKKDENFTCKHEEYEEETHTEIYENMRVGLQNYHIHRTPIPLKLSEETDDTEGDDYNNKPESNVIVYKDVNVNEQIEIPDVDDVSGEIRSEFDVIHWN